MGEAVGRGTTEHRRFLPVFGSPYTQTGLVQVTFQNIIVVPLRKGTEQDIAFFGQFVFGRQVVQQTAGLVDLGIIGEGGTYGDT